VCQKQHLPTVVANVDALKAKGVSTVAVTGVNDISVLDAWKKATSADNVDFLADGNGDFAKAIDLTLDLAGAGMGTRSKRYSMLIDDGVVSKLNVEEPGKFEVSSGDALLKQM
jgi:peroxiredoxin